MSCEKHGSFTNKILRNYIVFFALLAMVSTLCFPTPSTARVVNQDVLSMQLAPVTETIKIESNLLTEKGLTVLLDGDFTEQVIPITLSIGALPEISESETEGGTESVIEGAAESAIAFVNAVSSDEDRLQATVDAEEIFLQEKEITIHLTLRRIEKQPEAGDVSGNEGTVSGGNQEDGMEGDVSGNDAAGTPLKTESTSMPESTHQTLSAVVTLMYGEQTLSATFVIEEDAASTAEKASLASVAETDVSGGDASGEGIFEGDVSGGDVPPPEDTLAGDLAFCPSQYHPAKKLQVINGQAQDTVLGGFPAWTRYTLDEKDYLLYSGGSITLPAGKQIWLDLSLTDCREDLRLASASGDSYTVRYVELPQIQEEELPLIIGAEEVELSFSCLWGELEPVITVEHLMTAKEAAEWAKIAALENGETQGTEAAATGAQETLEGTDEAEGTGKAVGTDVAEGTDATVTQDTLVWYKAENITVTANEERKLTILPDKAAAGTYRLIVSWIENEITLYQMEIPFFVQYKSGDLGGSEQ